MTNEKDKWQMRKTMKLEMRMGNEERNGRGRKEKQKILEAEKETEKSQNIVSQSIGYTNVSKDSKADTDDISDLVDDIFG